MKKSARLLFGVRASAEVTLTVVVRGAPPPQPLELQICTSGGADRAVHSSGTTWTTTLAPSEHTVFLPIPNDVRLEDSLSVSISEPVRIVVLAGQAGALASWITDVGISADPKNPWPPPNVSHLGYEPTGSGWMRDKLATFREGIALERTLDQATA
jgi:hypothetical protein